MDRVTELPQAVDVAAQRARVHRQPLGQVVARPMAAGLQQGQHPQQA
jgi:hypothetical protein